jgi:hypothetical protein
MKHLSLTDEQHRDVVESVAHTAISNPKLRELLTHLAVRIQTGDEYIANYVGTIHIFQGKRGIIIPVGGDLVKVQVNEGPTWMTHSWITFDKDDWPSETGEVV